mmetsp:Transcript_71112/g.203814  ORF Transcript_71112/g.203814 Transcript_71112/m.203814 type:complete len:202 (-) Transcript_71112:28-633(-)
MPSRCVCSKVSRKRCRWTISTLLRSSSATFATPAFPHLTRRCRAATSTSRSRSRARCTLSVAASSPARRHAAARISKRRSASAKGTDFSACARCSLSMQPLKCPMMPCKSRAASCAALATCVEMRCIWETCPSRFSLFARAAAALASRLAAVSMLERPDLPRAPSLRPGPGPPRVGTTDVDTPLPNSVASMLDHSKNKLED